jgi:hypothetical protein
MTSIFSVALYRGTLADFMLNYMLVFPVSLFEIWSLATFWIPAILFVSLFVLGFFRLRVRLLSMRRCMILLGSACGLFAWNFASGVLFIYAQVASQPGDYEDYLPLGFGVGYIIRGCILLMLAAVIVCQNLVFLKEAPSPVPAVPGKRGRAPNFQWQNVLSVTTNDNRKPVEAGCRKGSAK